MSPVTHGLLSWVVAQTPGISTRRDRALITIAGLVPDIDGMGIIADWATAHSAQPLTWFADYHHRLAHNLSAAVIAALVVWCGAQRKWLTATLALVAFLLHLLCDVVGSKGPDGHQWPVPLFMPVTQWEWTWAGQWQLDSWQNLSITVILLITTIVCACRRGFSPVEMVSLRADQAVVATLRRWCGARAAAKL